MDAQGINHHAAAKALAATAAYGLDRLGDALDVLSLAVALALGLEAQGHEGAGQRRDVVAAGDLLGDGQSLSDG